MSDTTTASALREAGLVESTGPGRARIRIIEAGPGSSGTYLDETLREAANERVFAAGTLMYLDHPSASEAADRPERSVRDLAGRLTEDAVYENGALVADAEVFAHMRPIIEGLADTIGVSIRAMGDINEAGEVVRIDQARSVDYVTEAGAGGRVLELIESARTRDVTEARNAADWIEVEIHRGVMGLSNAMWGEGGTLTRDEWEAVAAATAEAMSAFRAALDRDAPQLADRDPLRPSGTETTGMNETTRHDRGGDSAPRGHDAQEARPMDETTATSVPGTGGATTPTTEATTLEQANARIAALERRDRERDARDQVRRLIAEHAADLPEAARGRIAATVNLDADDLTGEVTEAANRERAYIAEVAGTGRIVGMGAGDPLAETSDDDLREANAEKVKTLFA